MFAMVFIIHSMINFNANYRIKKFSHAGISEIFNELNENKTYIFIEAVEKIHVHPNP